MKYNELMTGAEVLNAYYKAIKANGINRYDVTQVAAEQAIDSYERLLSDYAEAAGCYSEWDERRRNGLEEES